MDTHKIGLISLTAPQIEGVSTPEELIIYTARVSNPNNQLNMDTGPKLIKYLLDNKHLSPFEQVDMCVEVETSRAIAAQMLRHWSFSIQEFSQRYSEVSDYIIYPARRQDEKNRQNSIDDLSPTIKEWFEAAQIEVGNLSFELYHQALDFGIAKEQARFLLPLNTKTKLYFKASIRDWIFYLNLRSGFGTQKEHADIAKDIINNIMVPNFPVISKSLGWI